MDVAAVLAAYDEQVRRRPGPGEAPDDGRVRTTGHGGWRGVLWSDLDETTADAAIAAAIDRFARDGDGGEWEWKLYTHDRPADLGRRLLAAGFAAEPEEAMLAAEVAALDRDPAPPAGVTLEPVADAAGIAELVALHDAVFGGDHSALGRGLLADLADGSAAAVVARAGDTVVSGGRIAFQAGTDFASLFGGGTLPEWRRRGIFRALVAHRAALAAARGFRFLQVDASDDSRPILRRLGFVDLTTTTPYVHPGA